MWVYYCNIYAEIYYKLWAMGYGKCIVDDPRGGSKSGRWCAYTELLPLGKSLFATLHNYDNYLATM
jgi:hypothetical protein